MKLARLAAFESPGTWVVRQQPRKLPAMNSLALCSFSVLQQPPRQTLNTQSAFDQDLLGELSMLLVCGTARPKVDLCFVKRLRLTNFVKIRVHSACTGLRKGGTQFAVYCQHSDAFIFCQPTLNLQVFAPQKKLSMQQKLSLETNLLLLCTSGSKWRSMRRKGCAMDTARLGIDPVKPVSPT